VLDNNKIKKESMGRNHLTLRQCKVKCRCSTRKSTALMGSSSSQTHKQKGINGQEPPDPLPVQGQVLHKKEDSSDGIKLLANT